MVSMPMFFPFRYPNPLQLPECLLCPRLRHGSTTQKIVGPMPDSFLRACKPTEAQGWAHVICSVFMQDLLFTDSTRLKAVEGVSMLAQYRWAAVCLRSDTLSPHSPLLAAMLPMFEHGRRGDAMQRLQPRIPCLMCLESWLQVWFRNPASMCYTPFYCFETHT